MNTLDLYLQDIWKKTLDILANSGKVSEAELTYYESNLVSLDDDTATVSAPNFFNYSIISENTSLLEVCLEEVLERKVSIKVLKEEEISSINNQGSVVNDFLYRSVDINQRFENFVTGRSNVQAHAAALTCAMNPGIVYNPLFIYGNSGLGKTHLLNAIGNKFKFAFPNKHIGFISGPDFVEGVYKASEEKRLDEFKNSFKSLDLLLVDDIQFIAGKPKTHEIFFTIFNDLVNNKKQICITADRTPSEIKDLEDRLISRFNQGLTVNIEAPEFETSINILKMKVETNPAFRSSTNIDEDVFNYLATNFSQDVRSLEGALNRLLFYATTFPIEGESDHISLNLAVEAFKDQIKETNKELTISTIRRVVCDYYGLSKQQIQSAARTKNIGNARHIAMYLCRILIDAPYQEIGREFGGRDHSTVMSACEKVEKLIKTDPLYSKAVNEIKAKIKQ